MAKQRENRLAGEKSPYLLQHKNNPVDWYPWGEEAFRTAKEQDKPVFLSIGYSTCHWCHVMEHESFSDIEIAKLMNETFINIKVDREERPDIDAIYMQVCQMMTGSGGWPLSVVMTPERKPFFAGTYFPPTQRGGRLGMKEIIDRTNEIWVKNRAEIIQSANEVTAQINLDRYGNKAEKFSKGIFRKAYHELASSFDEEYGGFGHRPKFPVPHNLSYLMKYYYDSGVSDALDMVEKTLIEMRKGGIYDQLGYGFHRYSTDPQWLVPHFEKMLYDEAMMLKVYTEAYELTGKPLYKRVAEEISTYILRDMQSPEGGFYAAEDADSEGEEGKFYVWDAVEFRKAAAGDAEFANDIFNIKDEGNYVDESGTGLSNMNILHLTKSLSEIAEKYNQTEEEIQNRIDKISEQLRKVRDTRIRPELDDKILTDWNGLMIASLAYAGDKLGKSELIDSAEKAARFVLAKLYDNDRLKHRYRDGEAGISGMFDDYAYFISGLISLYEATFNATYLDIAIKLTEQAIDIFMDKQKGGFYLTEASAELLIARQKELYDSAMPSGNSVMLMNLIKLFKLTSKSVFDDYADRMMMYFYESVTRVPSAHTHLLNAASVQFNDSTEIVIVPSPDDDGAEMIKLVKSKFSPNSALILLDENSRSIINKHAPYSRDMEPLEGKATAYVCRSFACAPPVNTIEKLEELLE